MSADPNAVFWADDGRAAARATLERLTADAIASSARRKNLLRVLWLGPLGCIAVQFIHFSNSCSSKDWKGSGQQIVKVFA